MLQVKGIDILLNAFQMHRFYGHKIWAVKVEMSRVSYRVQMKTIYQFLLQLLFCPFPESSPCLSLSSNESNSF